VSYSRSLAIVFATLVYSTRTAVAADKPLTIPLESVWAYGMPGTRPMQRVRGSEETAAAPKLISEIRGALRYLGDKKPAQGFAVLTKDALRQAHACLTKKVAPRNSFPSSTELSGVFFAYQNSYYVALHKVQRSNNRIEIQYRHVLHEEQILTEHLAIIPLGKFSPGEVIVDISQVDEQGQPTRGPQTVSQSFSFSVK
jgi:hypothetical protein